ncbi:MAG: M48 family metallopeptidase [Burkholderiales bacterium]|nr:M48 family metallopeptidase [Burkholderiales bacterium]
MTLSLHAGTVTALFCAFLLASLSVGFWLTTRQIRHVAAHRDRVPEAFADRITPEAHRKAADYTIAKARFSLLVDGFGGVVLLGWTLLDGLDALNGLVRDAVQPRWGDLGYQLALFAGFSLIGGLLDLPLAWWRTFRLEQRFGFNRSSLGLWLADQAKGVLVGVLIGGPLLAAVLWVMGASGGWWWLWAWCLWTGFALLMQVVYPIWIAPLFNQFKPLDDTGLAERVQSLMQRCGFQSKGFFVMDGSRRSAHGNAYFGGLGKSKRVVFYDTLLARLNTDEIEAVLAHELGHFHHRHIQQRMFMLFGLSFVALALLGWLAGQTGFYVGLGVQPNLAAANDGLALLLFLLASPCFSFFIGPLMAVHSRGAEFQADAYACQQTSARELSSALLKLYQDNASTLTPDPLYVRFHYSHPPASERLAAMKALA